METMELNGNRQDEGVQDAGETDGMPLDPERAAEAAEMTGPAAVQAHLVAEAHVEFVAAQYGGMDHMGGA